MATPSTPWDRIYQQVRLATPGVVDAVVQQELFRCTKDFLEQTNLWVEEVPIAVVPHTLSYSFTVSPGMANRLLIVYDPANAGPDKRWVQGGISMQLPGTIVLSNSPSSAATWMAAVAKIIVASDASGYPDIDQASWWIINKYQDAFYYGTMARLQMEPAKTYSNLKLGAYNNQQYITQRGKARADGIKANVYGGQRWQFPQQYATTARKGWT